MTQEDKWFYGYLIFALIMGVAHLLLGKRDNETKHHSKLSIIGYGAIIAPLILIGLIQDSIYILRKK